MKTLQYFQTRPLGTTTGNYALGYNEANELLMNVVWQHPDQESGLPDDVKIIETSGFSNGVLVKIEAEEWVISALKHQPEVQFDEKAKKIVASV